MALPAVPGSPVESKKSLVVLTLSLADVGVYVPHSERYAQLLEGKVGPHTNSDLRDRWVYASGKVS